MLTDTTSTVIHSIQSFIQIALVEYWQVPGIVLRAGNSELNKACCFSLSHL